MLQTIRDKTSGWLATLCLGAIAIVFVFWGINLHETTNGSTYAAKVNGETISMETARRAWQDRQARLQQMMHTELPPEFMKQQQQALLDEMIRTRLLTKRAESLGYRAGDAMVADTIMNAEELQADGKFSRERYATLLKQQGRTEPQFEQELRGNLSVAQLQGGVLESGFVMPAELKRAASLQGEEREFDYAVISAKALEPTAVVTDAQIQADYDAHKPQYRSPESVDLEYLELSLADVAKDVEVTDSALQGWYEQNKERYETPERRRARHILINVGDGVDDAAAHKTADDVLALVKAQDSAHSTDEATGATDGFAALAKKYSKDPGSAAQGGDLGWAGRGMFVGPFEDALFAMFKGEVRGPIKTQFGYHIIRLDDIEPAHVKTVAEARTQLEDEYRRDRAQALFYDRSQKLADQSFASLTELQSVAKSLGLQVRELKGFTRQNAPNTQDKAATGDVKTNPQFIEAAFSDEVLSKHQNSPLIAVGDDKAAVLRVVDHHLPEQLPLAAVSDKIVAELRARAARDTAAKQGAEAVQNLQAGASWSDVTSKVKATPAGKKFVARKDAAVPAPVLAAAFGVERKSLTDAATAVKPKFSGVPLGNGDYALLLVDAVRAGKDTADNAAEQTAQRQRLDRQIATDEFGAYVQQAAESANIKRNPSVFE